MITEKQITLIKDSWGRLIAYSEMGTTVFYPTFFELQPEVEALFKGNTKEQAQKLISAITLIITKLNKQDQLKEELKWLTKRHIKYGVKVAYLDSFEKAFLVMLKTVLGNQWTGEVMNAWTEMLHLIIQAMKEDLKELTS